MAIIVKVKFSLILFCLIIPSIIFSQSNWLTIDDGNGQEMSFNIKTFNEFGPSMFEVEGLNILKNEKEEYIRKSINIALEVYCKKPDGNYELPSELIDLSGQPDVLMEGKGIKVKTIKFENWDYDRKDINIEMPYKKFLHNFQYYDLKNRLDIHISCSFKRDWDKKIPIREFAKLSRFITGDELKKIHLEMKLSPKHGYYYFDCKRNKYGTYYEWLKTYQDESKENKSAVHKNHIEKIKWENLSTNLLTRYQKAFCAYLKK